MEKSIIRLEIEKILNVTDKLCFIDSRANGCYRMKLVTYNEIFSEKKLDLIKKLPHVIKVGYVQNSYRCDGITIHFDCKTREIKLNNETQNDELKENRFEQGFGGRIF